MNKRLLSLGCFTIGLGIILGAFGAHWLKEFLDMPKLQAFETGVKYQIYHGLAFILLGSVFKNKSKSSLKWAFRLMVIGILLFSGSLYLIALLSVLELETGVFVGVLTPIGGLLLIVSWLKIGCYFWANKQ
jgi:uncharacterized membrane protein YgdD (TMEM256/DUF423 family)